MKPAQTKWLVLTGIIIITALTRILPHPPNFTPIAAIGLFGAAHFTKKYWAVIIPASALLLSDYVMGYTPSLSVYASFAAISLLGLLALRKVNTGRVLGASLLSSILFFVITNFFVWYGGRMYPLTTSGLSACYTAAIPFFGNTIAGDLFYSFFLFVGYNFLQKKYLIPNIA